MRTRTLALALAAALPLAAHATDGYFQHGYGMQSKGMGGAATAIAESAFGAASNPATMAFVGNRWELGADLFSPWRKVERSGQPAAFGFNATSDSDSNYFLIPEFAYNRMLNPNLSFGVTVYGNGGMNTDYPGSELSAQSGCQGFNPGQSSYNMLCGTGRLGVDLMQLIVAPSLAYQVAPGHSVGIAPLLAYQRFKMKGVQAFAPFSTSPAHLTNNGYDDSFGYGVRFGYYGRLAPGIAVGAAYATKTRMDEFDKYRGLFAEGGGFDMPSHWSIAAAFQVSPATQVTAEYQRINYTDARSVGNSSRLILQCAGALMQGVPAANVPQCLGGADGVGFGWRDVDVWKIGVQHQVSPTLTVRAGYNVSDNPIRPEDVTFNILAPGVVRHHITLGATWALDQRSSVTGAFMYAFSNDVTGPSLLNDFAPGLQLNEKIKMYEVGIGVQYARRF
jgi:long-chain fatty acid transport protein